MGRNLAIFLTVTTLACLARAAVALRSDEGSMCNGSVAECSFYGGGGGEMEDMALMESWISQRMMEEQRRISYGALKRNQPACDEGRRGDSYSDSCLPPPSNPHSRGCSKYYRCRSDS